MAPDSTACAQVRTGGLGSESSLSEARAQAPAPEPRTPSGWPLPSWTSVHPPGQAPQLCPGAQQKQLTAGDAELGAGALGSLSGLTTGVLRDPWPSGPSGSSVDGSGEAFADPSSEGSLGALTPVAKPPPPQSRLLGAHGAAAPPQDWGPTPAKGETGPAMGSSWDPLTPVPCTSCPDRGCRMH